jgi:hypothetical protein
MIIHLIGFNKPVCKAAEEIKSFADDNFLISKIITNDKISILNEYLKNHLIINKCNLITCNEIKQLHKFINISSLYAYNSYAILVNTNSNNKYELELNKCMDITDIYNIHDNKFYKKNTINKYFI